MQSELALLLVAALLLPALLIALVPRRWLVLAMLVWPFAPLLSLPVLELWQRLAHPDQHYPPGTLFYGLALVGPLVALPWLATCLLGYGLGLALRRFNHALRPRSRPAAARTAPARPAAARPAPAAIAAPAPRRRQVFSRRIDARGPAAEDWLFRDAGISGDGLTISGIPVWPQPWGRLDLPSFDLPDPAYPGHSHRMDRYEIGPPDRRVGFAAGEASNGVWLFFTATVFPITASGTSPDGRLEWQERLGEEISPGRFDSLHSWYALLDTANGEVLAQFGGWSGIALTLDAGRRPVLTLTRPGLSAEFTFDMEARSFAYAGQSRPLDLLAAFVDEVRIGRGSAEPDGSRRASSPGGRLRVDLLPIEWSNSHWVMTPRVSDLRSGTVLLDLERSDCHCQGMDFPGPDTVRLSILRYTNHLGFSLTIDPEDDSYAIEPSAGGAYTVGAGTGASRGPLRELALALAPLTAFDQPRPGAGQRPAGATVLRPAGGLAGMAAWRKAVAILAAALAVLVLVAMTARTFDTTPHVVLTRMPAMPPPPSRP